MYCRHCGKEIADDARICQHCGMLIAEDIPPQTSLKVNHDSSSNMGTKEVDEDGVNSSITKYIGRICLYVIFLLVFFGIMEAINKLSRDLYGNSYLFYGAISSLGSIGLTFVIRYYIRKRKTISKDAKIFTIAVIVIILAYIFGKEASYIIAQRRLVESQKPLTEIEKEELAVGALASKLPIDIDEKTSWTKIVYETDSIYFEYLVDDSSLDYQIGLLDNYQEKFVTNLLIISNKQYIEDIIDKKKKLKFRIISQWDYSKYIDLSLAGVELEFVFKKVYDKYSKQELAN